MKEQLLNHLHETIHAKYKTYSSETDTEIRFKQLGKTLFIDFEGSRSYKDWKHNFDFKMKRYDGFSISFYAHAGIIDKWKSVESIIFNKITAPGVRVVRFRGFSQGGAMAQIAHVVMSSYCFFNTIKFESITFGAPNVFNKKSNINMSGLLRVELSNDIVCHLPPGIFGYKKFGQELVINTNDKWWKRILPYIDEHSPENYRRNIVEFA